VSFILYSKGYEKMTNVLAYYTREWVARLKRFLMNVSEFFFFATKIIFSPFSFQCCKTIFCSSPMEMQNKLDCFFPFILYSKVYEKMTNVLAYYTKEWVARVKRFLMNVSGIFFLRNKNNIFTILVPML
jgi:hypothetical protein